MIQDLLNKEPVVIVGAIIAGLIALLGGLSDGFQWNPDGIATVSAVAVALGIRFNPKVWSQDTVDELAPKSVQEKVKDDKRVVKARRR